MKVQFGQLQLDPAQGTSFGSLNIARQNEGHFGKGTVTDKTVIKPELPNYQTSSPAEKRSFQDYLLEAMDSMNSQQIAVKDLQEKVITNPDDVDIHDVTIAMSKARMSLNLAQTVIDRLVSGWNEITTTR